MNIIKELTKVVIIGIILVAGVSLVSAWTGPTQAPPGGNVDAPINVGSSGQIKSGALQVNGFRNLGATILGGNVGIGTTAPLDELHIRDGSDSTDTELILEYSGAGGGTPRTYSLNVFSTRGILGIRRGIFGIKDRTADVQRLVIDTSGNVGIGTTAPGAKLEVAGTAKTQKLQLGNKWLFSGVGDAHGNDEWLRMFDKDGTGYYGGIAADKFWAGSQICLSGDCRSSWPAGGYQYITIGECDGREGRYCSYFGCREIFRGEIGGGAVCSCECPPGRF